MPKPPPKQGSNRTGIKSGPNAQKTGPKSKVIDWDQVSKLGAFHCTVEEVAAFLGISSETLMKTYKKDHNDGTTVGDFLDRHRGIGRISLRRAQFSSAVNDKNIQMLIHLGKHYLNQKDVVRYDNLLNQRDLDVTEDNVDEWLTLAK